MPRPNYHHVKKQKELARKARQEDKKQRRLSRSDAAASHNTSSAELSTGIAGISPTSDS